MKRPWRRVSKVETIVAGKRCIGGKDPVPLKTRLTLECGHYVDIRKREIYHLPRRWRCCICQGKRLPYFMEKPRSYIQHVVVKPLVQEPAEHIDLKFTILPAGAEFNDVDQA